MTKQELVNAIAEKTGETKKRAEELVNVVLDTIVETAKVEDVKINGYFKTTIKHTKERVGRNPKNGEEINIPSKKIVKIKLGTKFDI